MVIAAKGRSLGLFIGVGEMPRRRCGEQDHREDAGPCAEETRGQAAGVLSTCPAETRVDRVPQDMAVDRNVAFHRRADRVEETAVRFPSTSSRRVRSAAEPSPETPKSARAVRCRGFTRPHVTPKSNDARIAERGSSATATSARRPTPRWSAAVGFGSVGESLPAYARQRVLHCATRRNYCPQIVGRNQAKDVRQAKARRVFRCIGCDPRRRST